MHLRGGTECYWLCGIMIDWVPEFLVFVAEVEE